ncbi:MAG: YfjI family protein, partial [Bryobacteraceae bacterium]
NTFKKPKLGLSTSDGDIVRRTRLVFDFDPRRPAGISATDQEVAAAQTCAAAAWKILDAQFKWPAAAAAIMSGNGTHLVWNLDLPNDDESRALLEFVLRAADLLFSTEETSLDTGMFNASRIIKVPGTIARKGDDTPDRPHRLASVISRPKGSAILSCHQLLALAQIAPKMEPAFPNGRGAFAQPFDLEAFLSRTGVRYRGPLPISQGEKFVLDHCFFDESHTGTSAAVIRRSGGMLGYMCQHNSCRDRHWQDVRERYDGPKQRATSYQRTANEPKGEEFNDEWPDPLPVLGVLPAVQAFDGRLLPASFRALAIDVAQRMQVPLDFPAAAVVGSLAGVVNRRALIQPKANDTSWRVVPNLWGGIIARPGFKKSPVIEEITQPIRALQEEHYQAHAREMGRFAVDQESYDLEVAAWKNKCKQALQRGNPKPERPVAPSQPKVPRLYYVDATFEALHKAMSEDVSGVFVLRDELTGWFAQLERQGREQERAFCLESWNGTSPFVIDRVERGTIHVAHCCMSLFGGIQPARLIEYLGSAVTGGLSDDGLMQRLQVLVWPDAPSEWVNVDREPDANAGKTAARVFRLLAGLSAEDPLIFRFAPGAQALFDDWYADLQKQIRDPEMHPALASHLSKYAKLMPALALLFELADQIAIGAVATLTVSLEHAKQAAEWTVYLESHARRIYSSITRPEMRAAAELAAKIKRRALGESFSGRDVYRRGWTGLDNPEGVKVALDILEDHEWVRHLPQQTSQTRGRPALTIYTVNPKMWSATT